MGGFIPISDTGGTEQNSLDNSKGLTVSDNLHSLSTRIESGTENLLHKYVIYLRLNGWDPNYKEEIKNVLSEYDENSQMVIIEKGIEYIAQDVLNNEINFNRGHSSVSYLVKLLSEFSGQDPIQIRQNIQVKCENKLKSLLNTNPIDENKCNVVNTITQLISGESKNRTLAKSSIKERVTVPRTVALKILQFLKRESKSYTENIANNIVSFTQDDYDDSDNTEGINELVFPNDIEDILDTLDNGGSLNSVVREFALLTNNLLYQGRRSSLEKILNFMETIKERVNTSTTLEMIYVVISDTLNRKERGVVKSRKSFDKESSTSLVSIVEFTDSKSALEYFLNHMTNYEKKVYIRAIDRFSNNYLFENKLKSTDETTSKVKSIINQAFFTGFSKISLYEEGNFRVDRISKTEGSINKIIKKGLGERNKIIKELATRVKRMSTPKENFSVFFDLGIEIIRGDFYYQNKTSEVGLNDLLTQLGKPELMTITEAIQLDEQLTYLDNRVIQSALGITNSINLVDKGKLIEIINSPQVAAQVIRGFCLEYLSEKYLGKTTNPLALPVESINDIANLIGNESFNYSGRKQSLIELGSIDFAGKIVSYLNNNSTYKYKDDLFEEIRGNVSIFFQQTFILIEQYKRNLENLDIDNNTKLTYQQRIITNFPYLFTSLGDEITLYPDQNTDIRLSIWKDGHNIDGSIVPTSIGLKQIIGVIQIVNYDDASKKETELSRLESLYLEAQHYELNIINSYLRISLYEKGIDDLLDSSNIINSPRNRDIKAGLLSSEDMSTVTYLINELYNINANSSDVRREIAGKARFEKIQKSIRETGILENVITQAIYLIQPFETKLIIWKEVVSKIYEPSHKREVLRRRVKSLRLLSDIFGIQLIKQKFSTIEVYTELNRIYKFLTSNEENTEFKLSELLRLKKDKISELVFHYVSRYSSNIFSSQYAEEQRFREIDSFISSPFLDNEKQVHNIVISNLMRGIKSDLDYFKTLGNSVVKDKIRERISVEPETITEEDLELLGTPSVNMLHKAFGIFPLIEVEKIKNKTQKINELLDLMEVYSKGFHGEHTYVLSHLVSEDVSKIEFVTGNKRIFRDSCNVSNPELIDSLFSTIIQNFNNIFGEEQTRAIFNDTCDQDVYSNLRFLYYYSTLNITSVELNEDIKTKRKAIYEQLGILKRRASIQNLKNGILRERVNITNSEIKYVDYCKSVNAVFKPEQKVLK